MELSSVGLPSRPLVKHARALTNVEAPDPSSITRRGLKHRIVA